MAIELILLLLHRILLQLAALLSAAVAAVAAVAATVTATAVVASAAVIPSVAAIAAITAIATTITITAATATAICAAGCAAAIAAATLCATASLQHCFGVCHLKTHSDGSSCVTDGLGFHENGENCTIRTLLTGLLSATEFQTEPGYDYITIGGTRYEGLSGPNNLPVAEGTEFTWQSDDSVTKSGWTLCFNLAPPPPPPAPPSLFSDESATISSLTSAGCYPSEPPTNLCYSKSLHGASSYTFHSRCDNKGATLTLVELSNGYKLALYTTVPWTSRGGYAGYGTSYIASITRNSCHHNRYGSQYLIYDRNSYGPTFGYGPSYYINSNMNGGYCRSGSGYFSDSGICGSYSSWSITALEVYSTEA